jgi:hypothetical protein
MTLLAYLAEANLPHWPIYAHLRSLNPRHLANILAKHSP